MEFQLSHVEVRVLGALILRGAQTVGELRGRTERLYAFDEFRGSFE